LRAWHLDLFEQPEIRFFNTALRLSAELCIGKFETLSLAKEISPVRKGVNRMWCLLAVQLAATFAVDS
jgi:hypothetical protein